MLPKDRQNIRLPISANAGLGAQVNYTIWAFIIPRALIFLHFWGLGITKRFHCISMEGAIWVALWEPSLVGMWEHCCAGLIFVVWGGNQTIWGVCFAGP